MVLLFKEPAGTVCHSFEAFSRDYMLLELEMYLILSPVSVFVKRLL